MRFEVEQKFRVAGHAGVVARLAELGAVPGGRIEQEDVYWNHPARDFAATNEALRFRRVGEANAVTYKGPKREGPTKTREEVEVSFAGGAEGLASFRRVFEALGFREVAVVSKARTPYRVEHGGRAVEVVLDEAGGLGVFVEVEAIAADEADLPGAQGAVQAVAGALGLTDPEPRSYLRMALERAGGG